MIIIRCGNPKVFFFFGSFVMGIFDSPVTKKFNQAFDNTSVVRVLGLVGYSEVVLVLSTQNLTGTKF